jgi:hypothetical protein
MGIYRTSLLTKKHKVFNGLETFDREYHEVENQGYIFKNCILQL